MVTDHQLHSLAYQFHRMYIILRISHTTDIYFELVKGAPVYA